MAKGTPSQLFCQPGGLVGHAVYQEKRTVEENNHGQGKEANWENSPNTRKPIEDRVEKRGFWGTPIVPCLGTRKKKR